MDGAELIELSGHAALAFVNSRARPNRRLIEQLDDGVAYLQWLTDAELIDEADATAARAAFSDARLDDVAAEARRLRTTLRPAIADWSTGATLAGRPELRDQLNGLLALDARYERITDDGRVLGEHRRWEHPRQLLVPPIAAVAEILTSGDRDLVRNCEDPRCTLWFYDRTKAHRRRWCAMSLCGNRAKVRAHRRRLAEPTA